MSFLQRPLSRSVSRTRLTPRVSVATARAASCTSGVTSPESVATPPDTSTRRPTTPRVRGSLVRRARRRASVMTSLRSSPWSRGTERVANPAQSMSSVRLRHAHRATAPRLTGTATGSRRRIRPRRRATPQWCPESAAATPAPGDSVSGAAGSLGGRWPSSSTPTSPARPRWGGCGWTSTPTPCGPATPRPRPRSWRRLSRPRASTSSASPTTAPSTAPPTWPAACPAGSSSGRSCARSRARSSASS
jgi:ribonuclease E